MATVNFRSKSLRIVKCQIWGQDVGRNFYKGRHRLGSALPTMTFLNSVKMAPPNIVQMKLNLWFSSRPQASAPPTIIFSTFPAAYPLALLHSTMLTTEMCSKCSPECVHHNLNSLLLQSSTQLTSSYITNLSLRHSRPHFLCPSNGIFSVPEKSQPCSEKRNLLIVGCLDLCEAGALNSGDVA